MQKVKHPIPSSDTEAKASSVPILNRIPNLRLNKSIEHDFRKAHKNPNVVKVSFAVNRNDFKIERLEKQGQEQEARKLTNSFVNSLKTLQFKNQRQLSIEISAYNLNPDCMKILCSGLSRYLPSLQKLELLCPGFLRGNCLESIAYHICRNFTDLSYLTVYFGKGNDGIKILVTEVCKSLLKLKHLDISLQGYINMGWLASAFSKFCSHLPELESLCLRLPQICLNEIDSKCLDDQQDLMFVLTEGLKRRPPKLKHLGLFVEDQVLGHFPRFLRKSRLNLQSLTFHSSKIKVDDDHILSILSQSDLTFANLKQLSLCFHVISEEGNYVKDEEILNQSLEVLGDKISLLLTSLDHFKFEYTDYCDPPRDKGCKIFFSRMIKSNSKLKHLSLNLCGWDISNEALEILGLQIAQHLKCLEHLELNFVLYLVTIDGLEKLASQLKHKETKLKSFTLELGILITQDYQGKMKKAFDFVPNFVLLCS